jgi:Flp pilus assembly pilin Flp
MIQVAKRFCRRRVPNRGDGESGQGLAEYALILVLIAAVCVVALGSLGSAIAGSSGFTLV